MAKRSPAISSLAVPIHYPKRTDARSPSRLGLLMLGIIRSMHLLVCSVRSHFADAVHGLDAFGRVIFITPSVERYSWVLSTSNCCSPTGASPDGCRSTILWDPTEHLPFGSDMEYPHLAGLELSEWRWECLSCWRKRLDDD